MSAGQQELVQVIQRLSLARTLPEVVNIVRHAARALVGADGASFVLREGDQCHYVDEDAIAPLWKGRRFPMSACISGWAMMHRQPAVIEDISRDDRIPFDAYEPTFVRSLVMVPIRTADPIGAIGTYWATERSARPEEVELLQSLADSTSIAFVNVQLLGDLERSLTEAREARDELARQLAARDEFLDVAAHELRTPLTPLSLQLDLLARKLARGQTDELSASVARCRDYAADCVRRTDELLELARIRLGQLTLTLTDTALDDVLGAAVAGFSRRADIAVHVEPGLQGRWDAPHVERMIASVLSNAVTYGAGRPIVVRARAHEGFAVLTVEDQGPGIPSEDQERLFEPFERAASRLSFGGLGLGLYVARAIARAHEGTITVESELGTGTRVTLRLPLAPPKPR